MLRQPNHINQLLTTAAAATGIVGDVDGLLTPIGSSVSPLPPESHRPERNLWRLDEILTMLDIIFQTRALELLNDKNVKSEKVFRDIELIMRKRGYVKKSYNQIWTKWKFLKSTYTTSKRNGSVPKMLPPPVFGMLHKILSASSHASDCGNLSVSLDGENSSNGASHLVISGVKGSEHGPCNENVGISMAPVEEATNDFDMTHGIFGTRLGLVKAEPPEAGYETLPAEEKIPVNHHFGGAVKREYGGDDSVLALQPAITLNPSLGFGINNGPQDPLDFASEVGNVLPPAETPTLLPMSASHIPHLRIAPFAKMSSPPGDMAYPYQQVPLHNTAQNVIDPNMFMKVDPNKSASHVGKKAQVRLARLKNIPERRSPYPQRLRRLMQNNDVVVSTSHHPPQPLPQEASFASQKAAFDRNTPSTSQAKRRKQRFDIPWHDPPQLPATSSRSNVEGAYHRGASTMTSDRPRCRTSSEDRTRTAKVESTNVPSPPSDKIAMDKVFEAFSSSILQMQRTFVSEFFDHQKEIARQEHEFQLQQDMMLMTAFREQTQRLINVAATVGVDLSGAFATSSQRKTAKQEGDEISDEVAVVHNDLPTPIDEYMLEQPDAGNENESNDETTLIPAVEYV